MNNLEFYTRWQKFMSNNMGAFAKWTTDVGELNELMIELSDRIRAERSKESNTLRDDYKDALHSILQHRICEIGEEDEEDPIIQWAKGVLNEK